MVKFPTPHHNLYVLLQLLSQFPITNPLSVIVGFRFFAFFVILFSSQLGIVNFTQAVLNPPSIILLQSYVPFPLP